MKTKVGIGIQWKLHHTAWFLRISNLPSSPNYRFILFQSFFLVQGRPDVLFSVCSHCKLNECRAEFCNQRKSCVRCYIRVTTIEGRCYRQSRNLHRAPHSSSHIFVIPPLIPPTCHVTTVKSPPKFPPSSVTKPIHAGDEWRLHSATVLRYLTIQIHLLDGRHHSGVKFWMAHHHTPWISSHSSPHAIPMISKVKMTRCWKASVRKWSCWRMCVCLPILQAAKNLKRFFFFASF